MHCWDALRSVCCMRRTLGTIKPLGDLSHLEDASETMHCWDGCERTNSVRWKCIKPRKRLVIPGGLRCVVLSGPM